MSRRSKVDIDEMQELRQENQDLKRTVARLRRRLQKLGTNADEVEEEEDTGMVVSMTRPALPGPKCTKCGGEEFKLFTTPGSTVRICVSCKTRTKV